MQVLAQKARSMHPRQIARREMLSHNGYFSFTPTHSGIEASNSLIFSKLRRHAPCIEHDQAP
jgi:hypothetical protein